MKLSFISLIKAVLLGWLCFPGSVLACNPEQDGCMGCDDEELRICLNEFVQQICTSSGNPGNCDAQRIYDDAERYVLISTGSHMSRIRTMVRSPRRYQLH